jgi:signal peptidase I
VGALGSSLARLPRPWRVILDWLFTIGGALLIVLAIKAWVVTPYRIPSSSMEPRLHCARPAAGCQARYSDRVLANRFIYRFRSPKRGEVVVFKVPPSVKASVCGMAGATFVKRLIGLPGDHVREDSEGFLWINGRKLNEPYIQPQQRAADRVYRRHSWDVPRDDYFMVGDNRGHSCDSRAWGVVPRGNLIGPVFETYWPPQRISRGLYLLASGSVIFGAIALYARRRRRERSRCEPDRL